MRNEDNNGYRPISQLRKCDTVYSGKYYSFDFAVSRGKVDEITLERHIADRNYRMEDDLDYKDRIHCADMVELRVLTDGGGQDEVCFRRRDIIRGYYPSQSFDTKFGVFKSKDEGEFGGVLTTPSGKNIEGNFVDVFESGDYVYAITSLSHLMLREFKLYRFHSADKYEIVYQNGANSRIRENLSYEIRGYGEESAFVLISGCDYLLDQHGHYRDYERHTRLIEIKNDKIAVVADIPYWFHYTYNMVIFSGKAYIGMDKMMAVLSLSDGSVELFTCLSIEEEENIIRNT